MLTSGRLASLCRARDRLREVDPPPASVHALAADLGLSTGAFIRGFASVFGETPHQYRIRARLERATRLLATGHSVTEACFAVGFLSVGSFSSLFARRIGVPPSVYQRRIRARFEAPGSLPAALAPGCLCLMVEAFRQGDAAGPATAISEKRGPQGPGTLSRA